MVDGGAFGWRPASGPMTRSWLCARSRAWSKGMGSTHGSDGTLLAVGHVDIPAQLTRWDVALNPSPSLESTCSRIPPNLPSWYVGARTGRFGRRLPQLHCGRYGPGPLPPPRAPVRCRQPNHGSWTASRGQRSRCHSPAASTEHIACHLLRWPLPLALLFSAPHYKRLPFDRSHPRTVSSCLTARGIPPHQENR